MCAALLVLGQLLAHAASGGPEPAAEGRGAAPGEYQVKAAFVYNFIKFVEWPSPELRATDTLRVCLLGDVAAAPFLELDGQEAMGRRLSVATVASSREARSCQVLFVAGSHTGRLVEVLAELRSTPVLTVGDTDGYAKRGIMINMYLENKRVRFEINAEAARAAGLRISAKLLKLAGTVHGAAQAGE